MARRLETTDRRIGLLEERREARAAARRRIGSMERRRIAVVHALIAMSARHPRR